MAAKTTKSTARPARPAPNDGLSIVVPLYNEARGLAALHGRIVEAARKISTARRLPIEIVYVDDGSTDTTGAVLQTLPADPLAPIETLRNGPWNDF